MGQDIKKTVIETHVCEIVGHCYYSLNFYLSIRITTFEFIQCFVLNLDITE